MKNKLKKHPFHANIDSRLETFSAEVRGRNYIDYENILFVTVEELDSVEYKQVGVYIQDIYDNM